MADYLKGRESRTQGVEVDRVFIGGNEAEMILAKGTQIFPNLPVAIWGTHDYRTIADAEAFWFEFAFKMDAVLTGNSATGFTDAGNYFRIDCEQSTDLVNWSLGKFIPSPAGAVINNGDGTYTYWSRATVPIHYFNVLVDLTITSNRYGKSITGLTIGQVPVTAGMSYPYAMPSQAATLQTHLRAAGYTGAVVSNVAAAMSVEIINHTNGARTPLQVVLSGTNVTMVKTNSGTNISLPSYPYAMPAQQATLQADLRAAGQSGAVVMLYGDEWTIFLPDRPAASPAQRANSVTITPDDPYPAWDMFGTYLGNQSTSNIPGTSGNVRSAGGSPQAEALKQFARLKIASGTRYNHLMP